MAETTLPLPPARQFDDQLLRACRHPHERPALALALGVLVALFSVLLLFDETTMLIALALVASFVAVVFLESLQVTRAIATAAEITPTQYPAFYPLVEELRQRFAMPRTRVFIRYYPDVPQAVAYGFNEPYVILVDELLASYVDADELTFVLARQMAHIKLGHTRLRAILGNEELELPALLEWITTPRDLAFAWWGRAQAMTADRAGVAACGRPHKAVSELAKAGIGPWLDVAVDVDALLAQAAELSHGWQRIAGFLTYVAEWEPPLIYRVQALLTWACQHGIALSQPDRDSDVRVAGEASGGTSSSNGEPSG
jgi:Zn-dependent protease with chaperone function